MLYHREMAPHVAGVILLWQNILHSWACSGASWHSSLAGPEMRPGNISVFSPADWPQTAGTLQLVVAGQRPQAAQADRETVRCGDQAGLLQHGLAGGNVPGGHQDPPHPGTVGLRVQLGHLEIGNVSRGFTGLYGGAGGRGGSAVKCEGKSFVSSGEVRSCDCHSLSRVAGPHLLMPGHHLNTKHLTTYNYHTINWYDRLPG